MLLWKVRCDFLIAATEQNENTWLQNAQSPNFDCVDSTSYSGGLKTQNWKELSDYPNLSKQTLLTDQNGVRLVAECGAFGAAAAYNRHCLE